MGYRIVVTAVRLDDVLRATESVKSYLNLQHKRFHSLPSRQVLNMRSKVLDVCGPKPTGRALQNMRAHLDALQLEGIVHIRVE